MGLRYFDGGRHPALPDNCRRRHRLLEGPPTPGVEPRIHFGSLAFRRHLSALSTHDPGEHLQIVPPEDRQNAADRRSPQAPRLIFSRLRSLPTLGHVLQERDPGGRHPVLLLHVRSSVRQHELPTDRGADDQHSVRARQRAHLPARDRGRRLAPRARVPARSGVGRRLPLDRRHDVGPPSLRGLRGHPDVRPPEDKVLPD